MQARGSDITVRQLHCARPKWDPAPTYTDVIDSTITRMFKEGKRPEDVAAAVVAALKPARVCYDWNMTLKSRAGRG